MKKILLLLSVLFLSACSYKVNYNERTETPMIEVEPNSTVKLAVYVPKTKTESLKAASNLGKDDKISINLGEYLQKTTVKYFKNYFRSVTPISTLDNLANYDYVLVPKMDYFEYGFSSNDGFDIDVKPFVQYELNLAIKKDDKLVFNKFLNKNAKAYKGPSMFFGQGTLAYATLDSLLQNSLFEYYNNNIEEILKVLR